VALVLLAKLISLSGIDIDDQVILDAD
jgi:hypothetical protein